MAGSKTELITETIVEIGKRFLPKMKKELEAYIDMSIIKYKRNNKQTLEKLEIKENELLDLIEYTTEQIAREKQELEKLTEKKIKEILNQNLDALTEVFIEKLKTDPQLRQKILDEILS